ncbi:MAG: hypothetical protein ACI8UO_006534 [Verrucomicrobiales bacterium]|jgi:hypothetical protein
MRHTLLLIVFATALAVTIPACQKKGPAEELGEKIDDAVEDLKESVDGEE